MRDRYYDRKNKSSSRLSGRCAIIITTGKKKDTVVCLVGARSLLRPEKKSSSRLSGGMSVFGAGDYNRKKKSSSRLSGGCAIVIMTGKKVLVVYLAGARSLLRPEKKVLVGKKSSSHLSGRCAVVITTGKKSSSRLSGGLCCCVSFWFWREIVF